MTMLSLLRQHPRYLGFGFLHYFFSAVGQTFFISLFVASMSERMSWEDGTFAALYSGATLLAAFSLPFIGTQVDRLRVRYVSTATALLVVAGCLILGFTRNIYLLAAGLFVVRLGGQGVLTLIGSTTIGRYFEEGRGKALSASIIGISVAEVLLPSGVVYLLEQQGYGTVWLIAAHNQINVVIENAGTYARAGRIFNRVLEPDQELVYLFSVNWNCGARSLFQTV